MIGRALRKRYRQAKRSGARVLVVPPVFYTSATGPLGAVLTACNLELTAILPTVSPPEDVVDASGIGAAEHSDFLHLSQLGHAKLAEAIIDRLD